MPQSKRRSIPAWSDLVDAETGRLLSPVPLDALIFAEHVRLDGGVLYFDWKAGFNYVRPPSALLERFIGLRTDSAILTFARHFGPLGLSEGTGEPVPDPQPFNHRRGEQGESVESWRRYQWEFNALLGLASELRHRRGPPRELFDEWQRLGVVSSAPRPTLGSILGVGNPAPSLLKEWPTLSAKARLEIAANFLQGRTNGFIRACRLRPALTFGPSWPPSRVTMAFQDATADHPLQFGLSLFGALTVSLLAASNGAGFAVCSACGGVFVPRRRQPAFGKRRYCGQCGRKAALKDAKADYRARLRAGKRKKEAARGRTK